MSQFKTFFLQKLLNSKEELLSALKYATRLWVLVKPKPPLPI
nr:MAG TPA: hypothetical protein [Caudoviricetes sp.]